MRRTGWLTRSCFVLPGGRPRSLADIGMQATGRAQEQGRLGLSGRPYCSGLGYLLNTLCME